MLGMFRKLWKMFGPQALKFCVVGGLGVVLSSGVLYGLTEYCHVWYLYSNWIAVVVAQIFSFLGYKYWAFTIAKGQAAYPTSKQFLIHWFVWGVGLGISTLVIYSLTTYGHVWYMLSSWVATAISGASNFLSHRYWTYSPKD